MMSFYEDVCHQCSEQVTKKYSTSFYSAIRLLHKDLRKPINDIYGFVRFADEIVDTFHQHDRAQLLQEFTDATWKAIYHGISMNPILHSFQNVVQTYNIPPDLITAFLNSMEMDLHKKEYSNGNELDQYIYGSAEVVGLMCLCVFCDGNTVLYDKLKQPAQKLGAAFQKVNFLRDMNADLEGLDRSYFPELTNSPMDSNEVVRIAIERNIEQDFKESLAGIRALPWKARFGVYTAYMYYNTLFNKIKKMQLAHVMAQRVRVPDYQKLFIVMNARIRTGINVM